MSLDPIARGLALRPSSRVAYIEDAGITPWLTFDATTGVPTGSYVSHTAQLQALADKLSTLYGGGVISSRGAPGAIIFGSSLILPMGVGIDMPSARKRPVVSSVKQWTKALRFVPSPVGEFRTAAGALTSVAADGSCVTGYLIFGNLDPSIDAADYLAAGGSPGPGVGELRNIRADGAATSGISVFRGAGSYRIHNLVGDYVATAVSKVSSLYTDKFQVDTVDCYIRPDNTSALIDVRGTGDGLEIRNVESGYWDSGGGTLVPAQGVLASNCRGGDISMLINGVHTFAGGSGITVRNCHIEGGHISIDHSVITLRDNHFHNGAGLETPIQIKNTSTANGYSGSVTLSGNTFAHYINAGGVGHTGWSSTDKLDVLLDTGAGRMDIVDDGTNRRIAGVSGQLDVTTVVAPRIGTIVATVETPITDLLNYGPMLQRKSMWINNSAVNVSGVIDGAGAWVGISGAQFTPTGSGVTFGAATATYYYKAQILLDPVRLIGRGATGAPAAITVAATSGAATVPKITFDFTGMAHEGGWIVRLYRSATADDAFTKYVDIPAIAFKSGLDDGVCFASFPWKARASGAMDTVASGFTGTLVLEAGGMQAKGTASATPTIGTWKAGDKTYLAAPSADGNNMVQEGSTCTVAGTPGTWVARRFSTVSPAT